MQSKGFGLNLGWCIPKNLDLCNYNTSRCAFIFRTRKKKGNPEKGKEVAHDRAHLKKKKEQRNSML